MLDTFNDSLGFKLLNSKMYFYKVTELNTLSLISSLLFLFQIPVFWENNIIESIECFQVVFIEISHK